MFIAELFGKTENVHQCEWINKIRYIHVVEYSLALKRMKYWFMLQHGENTILGKRKPDTKDHRLCDPMSVKCPEEVNPSKPESRLAVALGQRKGRIGSDRLAWMGLLLWGVTKCSGIQKWSWLHSIVKVVKVIELYTLKW